MSPMGDAANHVQEKFEEQSLPGETFEEWLERAADATEIPTTDGGTRTNDACSRAVAASQEVIMEECEGESGRMVELPGNAFAFITEDMAAELPFDPANPEEVDDREEAIQACMDSEWAREWADGVVGEDATGELDRQARRRACEGLFD